MGGRRSPRQSGLWRPLVDRATLVRPPNPVGSRSDGTQRGHQPGAWGLRADHRISAETAQVGREAQEGHRRAPHLTRSEPLSIAETTVTSISSEGRSESIFDARCADIFAWSPLTPL